MFVGKIWILLYAIPPSAMLWVLFRIAVSSRWRLPGWVYIVFALGIGLFLGPIFAIFGFALLDELAGPDWLGLHAHGLGAPDPLYGPAIQWALTGGFIGAASVTIVRLARQGGRLP